MQYLVFIILSPITATIAISVLFYIRQNPQMPVSRTLFWFFVAVSGYLIFNTMELVAQSEAVTLWFAKANYVFIAVVPVLWFAFALQYTGNTVWLGLERFWLFLVFPVLTNIFVQTNELHGLIWSSVLFLHVDYGMVALKVSYGPWFWIHGAYSYLLVVSATFLLGRDYFRAYQLYRKQSYWIIFGTLTPLLVNLLYIFRVFPGWTKDFTSVGFGIGGIALAIGIYRFQLFDLMPVARSALIDKMQDGMLVLDNRHRVVDLNPTAQQIIQEQLNSCIGRPVFEVLPALAPVFQQPDRVAIPARPIGCSSEFNGKLRYFDIHISHLDADQNLRDGYLVLMHDITERRVAQDALRQLNEELEERVRSRTQDIIRRAAELEAMADVSSALRRAVTLDNMLDVLIKETGRVLQADAGLILLDRDGEFVVAALDRLQTFDPGDRIAIGSDPFWKTYLYEQSLITAVQNLALTPDKHGLDQLVTGFQRLVFQPIQTAERSLGILLLLYKTQVTFDEETWRLLRAIAEMGSNAIQRVQVMETLEQLVQHRTRDLSILYEITAITNEFINLDHLLAVVLDLVLKAIGAEAGVLHLLQEDESLVPVAHRGFSESQLEHMGQYSFKRTLCWRVIEENQIVIAPDFLDPPFTLQQVDFDNRPVYIGVPVHAKGRLLGVLCILSLSLSKYSPEDLTLLAAIADHIGGAVEASQLRAQAEQAAVIEDRQRLARDLHDSVMQSLYSLILFAEAGSDALQAGTLDLTKQYLSQLNEAARQALKEMRLLVFDLRPDTLQQEGLAAALHKRIEVVEQRAGIATSVNLQISVELSEQEETGLYRIAQEALNNVLKHSGASQVRLELMANERSIHLVIEDDGRGFDSSDRESSAGVGLTSMSERAGELGGWVTITSSPGQGTRVHAQIVRETGAHPVAAQQHLH